MKKIALVQHFLSHYRHSVFNNLAINSSNKYLFVSAPTGFDGIRTIDIRYAHLDPEAGGFCWKFVQNYRLGNLFLWQSGIVNLSISRDFNAIIFLGNMYHLSTWIGVILARISGKKVIMWTHGFLRNETGLKGMIRFLFYRLAHGLLLYGHRAKEILVAKGYPCDRMEVIYNSLDYDNQKFVRDSVKRDSLKRLRSDSFTFTELPVIIFIGRLTSQKKLDQLLEATKILHKRSFPVNVLIVGSGPEMSRLVNMSKEYGLLDYVCFYGETYDENEIGKLISMSDLCVSPGEVGLTCIHAMAYGVPVITHDDLDFQMPEVEAIRPGVTGDFFKRDDLYSLADAIHNFFQFNQSRDQIKLECIRVVESNYNSVFQVNAIDNFINRLFKS